MADLTQEEIERLIAGGAAGGPGGAVAGPPYDPLKSVETLQAHLKLYERQHDFRPGDAIRQVLGLCVQERATSVKAFVFAKYLETPVVVNFPMHFNLDCVIGTPDSEGELLFIVADSHRFEPYPREDLESLSAEAKKAIN